MRVNVTCNIVELMTFRPFTKALEFSAYYSDVTVYCIDDGHSIRFHTSPEIPGKLTVPDLVERWEQKYGPFPR